MVQLHYIHVIRFKQYNTTTLIHLIIKLLDISLFMQNLNIHDASSISLIIFIQIWFCIKMNSPLIKTRKT